MKNENIKTTSLKLIYQLPILSVVADPWKIFELTLIEVIVCS